MTRLHGRMPYDNDDGSPCGFPAHTLFLSGDEVYDTARPIAGTSLFRGFVLSDFHLDHRLRQTMKDTLRVVPLCPRCGKWMHREPHRHHPSRLRLHPLRYPRAVCTLGELVYMCWDDDACQRSSSRVRLASAGTLPVVPSYPIWGCVCLQFENTILGMKKAL
jgi:hypothetical protein